MPNINTILVEFDQQCQLYMGTSIKFYDEKNKIIKQFESEEKNKFNNFEPFYV